MQVSGSVSKETHRAGAILWCHQPEVKCFRSSFRRHSDKGVRRTGRSVGQRPLCHLNSQMWTHFVISFFRGFFRALSHSCNVATAANGLMSYSFWFPQNVFSTVAIVHGTHFETTSQGLWIYFGSQMGTAEGFSRELEEEASKLEIPAMVVDMEDIFSTGRSFLNRCSLP